METKLPKRVRVEKCTEKVNPWYRHCIGKEFKVIGENNQCGAEDWITEGAGMWILKSDCTPIYEEEEAREEQGDDFAGLVSMVLGDIGNMLIQKNKAYGNSALQPLRIFAKSDTEEQLNVRIDDKLSRILRGEAAGEDVEKDLIGYLILKQVRRKMHPSTHE